MDVPFKLSDLKVAEVSVVPRGANKQRFLIVKEDDSMDTALLEALKKAGYDVALPAKRLAAVEKLLKDAGAAVDDKTKAAIMSACKILQTVSGALPDGVLAALMAAAGMGNEPAPVAQATPPPAPVAQGYDMPMKKSDGSWDFSKIPDAARPLVESLWKDKEANETRIAKAEAEVAKERDARLTKEYVEKAADLKGLGLKTDELGKVLKALAEKAPEALTALEPMLKTVDEKLKALQGTILKEHGTSAGNGAGGDAWSKIEKIAKDAVTAAAAKGEKVSFAKAVDDVMTSQPALYAEYEKEEHDARRNA